MAKPKLTFKTPLAPLSWVTTRGTGKLKKDKPDDKDPINYNYTATVTLTETQAKEIEAKFNKFWRDNKPSGVGKQKYELVKKEMIKVLDAKGEPALDADDEPIKEHTGMYTLQAKTLTQWPDGKPNHIILQGSNGKPLAEGHPIEGGCGEGTMGILKGSIGINAYNDNEGLQFYLQAVQIKDSTYAEYTGGDTVDEDTIDDEGVNDTDIPEQGEGEMPAV